MGIANYVRNGRRFGDRKMLTGAKIPKMSLQAYDTSTRKYMVPVHGSCAGDCWRVWRALSVVARCCLGMNMTVCPLR